MKNKMIILMLILFVLLACNLPWVTVDTGNIFNQPPQTLTAMFQNPKTSTPVVVSPTLQPPTITSLPTLHQPPTFTPIPTQQPTFTPLPPQQSGLQRNGVAVNARYLSTPPLIDGNWDEWKDLAPMNLVGYVLFGSLYWKNVADLNGDFILGWDNQYLYLGIQVIDDVYVQNSTGAYIYKGDDIELQVDADLLGDFYVKTMNNDDYQMGLSAGKGALAGPKEAYLWYPKVIQGSRTDEIQIASTAFSGFHIVEARIPWLLFAISPYTNLRMGFALSLSDNDNPSVNNWQTFISDTPGRKTTDPTTWGELHLTS